MSTELTVVIPNYNGSQFLNQSIDSALNQTDISVEVIVVDDGSCDESQIILTNYGHRIKVLYQENKGAPAARNLGWKKATSNYIKFLDSDDVLLPGILKQEYDQNNQLSDREITYGNAIWTNENLEPQAGYSVLPILPHQSPLEHILTQNPLTSCPLHKKNLLEEIGGFDETLVKGQEFDLHLRLVLNGVNFIHNNLNVYYFRQSINPDRISNISISKFHNQIFNMLLKQENLIIKELKKNENTSKKTSRKVTRIIADRYLLYAKAITLNKQLTKSMRFYSKWLQNQFKSWLIVFS